VTIVGDRGERRSEILTDGAVAFVADLYRSFGPRRTELLQRRAELAPGWLAGENPGFHFETREIREGEWAVRPPPPDLVDRRVEITGPVDRKMVINALNSGARVFMADFEDATSPTWENVVDGQVNLADAVRRSISLVTEEREYLLEDEVATLVIRPRGLHMVEKHLLVDGNPVPASFFDFGLYVFHNGAELVQRGSGPYCYLPKMESHLEARLWNEVFTHCEATLGLAAGTIRATVLIETILAAFEMEEILYELRDHSSGLNAGRWDYIFSLIKTFRSREDMVLPDRSQITMTVPFMRSYTEQLVRACHRRGAHAIGGMAAFIPNRRDPEVTGHALAAVAADKRREAADGFDGTWVAHPDLVETAMKEFDAVLGSRPNQVDLLRDDVAPDGESLLDVAVPGGKITDDGLRLNVSVGLQYLASWLRGTGAAAIDNLMEDAATAEISRSQVWQWVHHRARTTDGAEIARERVRLVIDGELDRLREQFGGEIIDGGRFPEAADLFAQVALDDDFPPFLTIPAYELI
jgi:malate synthase